MHDWLTYIALGVIYGGAVYLIAWMFKRIISG